MNGTRRNLWGMPKRPKQPPRPPKQFRPLYIGQWIYALGKRPVDVVKATGMNEGYLSQLISGERKNPSGDKLYKIAEFLEIPLGYLYRLPPDRGLVEESAKVDPAVMAKLKAAIH